MSAVAVGELAPRLDEVSAERPLMGGRVGVLLRDRDSGVLERDARLVLDRIGRWAGRLTRFDPASELCRLNAARRDAPVGPTLTAVLDWARVVEDRTDGLVDVSMLEARLAAERSGATEGSGRGTASSGRRAWSLDRRPRGAVVRHQPGVRFDLDGVAKGWLADRALGITTAASALVDADGDIAARVAPGDSWEIGVGDPRDGGALLAIIRLAAAGASRTIAVATSGTSVHRWAHDGGATHHLIDPRTGLPARTDVVQATVVAPSARVAEAFAKVAVVAGTHDAFRRLDRADVFGVLLLTERGALLASPEMTAWLA